MNNIEKFDDAIMSRCLCIEIKDPPVSEILYFMKSILNEEGISYDDSNLSFYVQKNYPDIRKTINEIKGNCIRDRLEMSHFTTANESFDKSLIDLRMYMAFYGLKRKEVYDFIKDKLEVPIQSKIFYMLLDPKLCAKVGLRKKEAVINCINEIYPLRKWLHDYMSLEN
jgi:DNA polymerase III delta prime subunit